MNIVWTQTTEERPARRLFSAADISRMMEAGVLGEDERIELVEGEIVVMAAKHAGHENIKNWLIVSFARAVPGGLYVTVESTLQLAPDVLVEPDIAIIPRSIYRGDPKAF